MIRDLTDLLIAIFLIAVVTSAIVGIGAKEHQQSVSCGGEP